MSSLIFGVILDLILGDPYSFPHPVKLMGRLISLEEGLARKLVKSSKGLKIGGLIMTLVNLIIGFLPALILLRVLENYRVPYMALSTYIIYTSIAAKSLHYEAKKVSEAMDRGLEEARHRLSYIVGRDTSSLNEEEIIRATVETVAENTSDGVIGPLFYIVILGPPGGLAYKFVNTMDSMVGYMDDKYKDLGYFPAKIDDLFNLIPARITALLMNISSIGSFDLIRGFKILKRDRKNHKSPNSGYPESAIAGLLGIELGGGGYYHGRYVDKPSIGDKVNSLTRDHISKTIEIMYRTEILFLLIYLLINAL